MPTGKMPSTTQKLELGSWEFDSGLGDTKALQSKDKKSNKNHKNDNS